MSRPVRSYLIALLAVVLLLTGCTRSEEARSEAERSAADVPDGDTSSMALTDEGRARAQDEDSDGGDAPAAPVMDPRDSAFAAQRLRAVASYPIDFYIGTIGSPPSGRASAAWTLSHEILRGLLDEQGDLSHPALSAGDRRVLAELAASGPFETLRIARPVVLGDQSYSMEFRLRDGDNDFIGEIVVDVQNAEWYTAGIQARPSQAVRRRYAPDADVPGLVW